MNRRLHCSSILLPDGWHENVLLELDDRGIVTRITHAPPEAGAECLPGVVLPGMPNLHSHGFQRAMAGLSGQRVGEDSFWTWRETMYDIAAKLTPERLGACMGGVFLEMLRAGFTSCAEFHYLHNDARGARYPEPAELSRRVMTAALDVGIALTHLPVLYCRSGFGARGLEPAQSRFGLTPDHYAQLVTDCRSLLAGSPTLRLGLAPHSLRAVNQDELQALLALALPDEPLHIHVAEQPREVADCEQHLGLGPISWLLKEVGLSPRWCLVHATHMSASELKPVVKTGAVAGLCPTTEADLGDGIFNATAWATAGGRWGIGSDSNLRVSVSEELRSLEFSQRLRDGARNLLAEEGKSTGRALYESAARGGAQALAQPVGEIRLGKRADLVQLDTGHRWLAGLSGDDVIDAYVFAGQSDMIATVHVAGKRVLEAGHHVREASLDRSFSKALKALRS